MKETFKKTVLNRSLTALLLIVFLAGCQVSSRPRLRVSDFFGNPWGMKFPDPEHLGRHSIDPSNGEKLGMVYTCKGGFIDLGHLREAADRTQYVSQILYSTLIRGRTSCTYRIIEPSHYHLTISYPEQWQSMSWEQKKAIARDVSIRYGQYLAHTSLIWHEILTWYGFASSGVFSENISAFSWEDPYSDILGTRLAVLALTNTKGESYEDAMTRLIDEALRGLDVQPAETARKAADLVEGEWFDGGYYFFVEMKKRNFDVGLDDELVTPWLVPGICPDAVPQDCPTSNLSVLEKYGFKTRLQIEPVEFEKVKIYEALHLNPSEFIRPSIHFPEIVEAVRKDAEKLEGNTMDVPPQSDAAIENQENTNKGCDICP
jgi:hypothetical protein